MVRYWYEARDGLGYKVDNRQVLFYADDGFLSSTHAEWLQAAFDLLTALFDRIGLCTNPKKTKVIVCLPGAIRAGVCEDS